MKSSRHLVDPELLPMLELVPPFELNDETLADMRSQPLPPFAPDPKVRVATRVIPGPTGAPDIRLLILTPAGVGPDAPCLLHIHGGGFVGGSADMFLGTAQAYALEAGCVVVSTDYRLAPEARWPEPLDDVHAALVWTYDHAHELGIDRDRIAIGGESAGGGLAAMLALHARDHGPAICFQLLIYPMIDDRPSTSDYAGEFIWTRDKNRYGWSSLLGVPAGSDQVPERAVPARVADLSGLPPTYIATGALDLFVDEDIDYARRLLGAGVPTELRVVPGAWHGFDYIVPDAAISRNFIADAHRALAAAFAHAKTSSSVPGADAPALIS